MKKKEFLRRFRSGDLLAWESSQIRDSFIGYMIGLVTKNKYCHVGLLWVYNNEPYVLTVSWNGGVLIKHLENDLPCYVIPMEINWNQEIEKKAMFKLGRKYHYFDAFRLGFKFEKNLLDTEVCTHFVAMIYSLAGHPDITKIACFLPDNIIEYCLAQNENKIFEIDKLED